MAVSLYLLLSLKRAINLGRKGLRLVNMQSIERVIVYGPGQICKFSLFCQ